MEELEFEVVLASASPRRRALLEEAGVPFRTLVTDVDESLEPDLVARPLEAVKKLAERKAHAAVERLLVDGYAGALIVLGSDTMVVLDDVIFGKPADAAEATHMLESLSGNTHQVHTAVSVWMVHAPAEGDISLGYRTFVDTTDVTFRALTSDEIAAYVATGDPLDKAGAYGIQSGAGVFVDHIDGALDTVIGMPVERLLREIPDIPRRA